MKGRAHRGRLATALLGATVAWFTGGEHLLAAEVDPVALVWTAPAGCPSADAIHGQVETALGIPSTQLASVAAVVTVAQGVGRWQATMTLHSHGERSERTYDAESCEALGSATALIIALAAEGQDERSSGAAAGGTIARSQTSDRERPTVHGEPPWTWSPPLLQVGATFDHGTMPYSYAPGVEVSAGPRWNASLWQLRLLAGASFFAPQSAGEGLNDSYYIGRFWLLTVAARGCATAVLGAVEFGPCLGGELAFIHASDLAGTGSSDTQYWLSLVGGLMAEVSVLQRGALFARGEVAFPTTTRTVMEGALPVYDIPSHATRVVAGFELRFF